MRTDYRRGKLRREDLNPDPIAQFQLWLDEASAAKVIEPTAMSLATVGKDGSVRVRTVLLKGLDARGFVFLPTWKAVKRARLPRILMSRFSFPGLPWSAR
jgi:pyridoxamine 5'-phosphate oxidase